MITPIDFDELRPDLRDALRARYERLGYLGDFFRHMAHQPDALIAFDAFTEAGKHALAFELAEAIALTAATRLGNDYERHQHERLAVRNGLGREWVAAVERLEPGALPGAPGDVQRYVLAAIDDLCAPGDGSAVALDALVERHGDALAAAVALLTARFVGHATVSRACRLRPSVPSIFDPRSDV